MVVCDRPEMHQLEGSSSSLDRHLKPGLEVYTGRPEEKGGVLESWDSTC